MINPQQHLIVISKLFAGSQSVATEVARKYCKEPLCPFEDAISYRFLQQGIGEFATGSLRAITQESGVFIIYGQPKNTGDDL